MKERWRLPYGARDREGRMRLRRCRIRARWGSDDAGNMLPLAAMSALVLFSVLAFAVDQGLAYAAKVDQENALDSARTACMDASFALVAKNEEDPGRAVALQVARTVRDEGFEGELEVWFYEAPAADTSEAERLWVVGMQVIEDVPTMFARGFGVETLPVASHRVVTAVPYADGAVWRPSDPACGKYVLARRAPSGSIAFARLGSLEEYPEEMVACARAATAEKRP